MRKVPWFDKEILRRAIVKRNRKIKMSKKQSNIFLDIKIAETGQPTNIQ